MFNQQSVVGRIRLLGRHARQLSTSKPDMDSKITFANGKTLPIQDQDISFHMPAEFERHAGCWIAWPKRFDVWRHKAEPAKKAYAEVMKAVSRFEPVTVVAHHDQVRAWCGWTPRHNGRLTACNILQGCMHSHYAISIHRLPQPPHVTPCHGGIIKHQQQCMDCPCHLPN